MLFGCLPIQNIPVFVIGYGLIAFSIWAIWQDYKDEMHAKGVARVQRCEIHRKAMHLMKQGRKSRAERMSVDGRSKTNSQAGAGKNRYTFSTVRYLSKK